MAKKYDALLETGAVLERGGRAKFRAERRAGLVNLHMMWPKIKNGTVPWYLKPIKDGT